MSEREVIIGGVSMPLREWEARQRKTAFEQMLAKDEINRYRCAGGYEYECPSPSTGFAVIEVLPELRGLPLCNAILGMIHGLRPSCIRVSAGEVTTDSRPWRVTVLVDADDRVTDITQEVSVVYGAGCEVREALRFQKSRVEPAP